MKKMYILEIIEELNKYFKVTVMSNVNSFIGLNIILTDCGMTIDQSQYIRRCAKAFQISDAK